MFDDVDLSYKILPDKRQTSLWKTFHFSSYSWDTSKVAKVIYFTTNSD